MICFIVSNVAPCVLTSSIATFSMPGFCWIAASPFWIVTNWLITSELLINAMACWDHWPIGNVRSATMHE